jgi:hypothetical protein
MAPAERVLPELIKLHYRKLRRAVVALGAMLFCACGGNALASSFPVTLGTSSTYGVLVGSGDSMTLNAGLAVSGNVGFGANDSVNLNYKSFAVSGNAYEASGFSTSHGSLTVSGTTYSTYSMTQAITDATTASTAAAGLTATVGLTNQGGSINLNGTSLVIKALGNLSENVLNISALSLTNGTITFDDNGYTGAKFIVNISGNFNVSSSGSGKSIIQGINGASASDIIFNIENSGSTVSITGNSTNSLIGTILDPASNVTLGGGGTLTGALLAGFNNAGKAYTVTDNSGGFNITSFGYTPRSGGRVPEPSSIATFGVGILAVAALARRRRKAPR